MTYEKKYDKIKIDLQKRHEKKKKILAFACDSLCLFSCFGSSMCKAKGKTRVRSHTRHARPGHITRVKGHGGKN